MSKRTKWTRDVVEVMWAAMEANQHLRKIGQMDSWWGLIAAKVNDEFNLGLTGSACAKKAGEVHKAKRMYPWDAGAQTANKIKRPQANTNDELRDALFALVKRFDRLERNLTDLVEGKVIGTPDIKPVVNQLWVSRTKLDRTNGQHATMRISEVEGKELTLEEVGGTFVYTLPLRNLHRYFAHVGFANPRPHVPVLSQAVISTPEPLQLPQAPIKGTPPPLADALAKSARVARTLIEERQERRHSAALKNPDLNLPLGDTNGVRDLNELL